MSLFDQSKFNPVLAGLAGEKLDPDDAQRFKADKIAPAYNVGFRGRIPSVEFGAAKGKHKGGRLLGGPAERSASPRVVEIDALSASEKRDIEISTEEAYSQQMGRTPEESRRLWEAACVAKAARELMAYSESDLETWLKGSWNTTASSALGAADRFDQSAATVRQAVVDLIQGVDADVIIMDRKTDRLMRKHANFTGVLASTERSIVKRSVLLDLLQEDHERLQQIIVLDAQDDPKLPDNPIVGASSGFLWAGRLMPSLPRRADQARSELVSHNFAFLRGFHTGMSNPALAAGSRLSSRVGGDEANASLAGIQVITTYRDAFVTRMSVYSSGKYAKINANFGGNLTNTWV